MADKTYIINFKANVQGMDNVIQQFEKILNMDGLNLTEGMSKQWQQLKTMASSYIEQMNAELAKPQPDMAVLEQLDKRLTQITTKATNFSDALAKVVLPKDLLEKLTALQKKISDINEQTKQLNQKRFGNERKLNAKNDSGLAQTEENRIFNEVNDGPVGIGNNVISSWRDFVNTVNELKTSGQLTGKQLEEVETIIKNTASAMAIRKSEIEASVQADRDSIAANKQKVAALQQEISTLNSSDNAQDKLTAEQQEYLALIKQLSGAITQLRAQQINTTEEVERATNAQHQQNIAIQQSTTAQRKNTSVIGQAAKQVLTYGSIVGLLRRAYQTTISTIKEMDEALTGMAVVTSMSRQEAWAMAGEFENLAQATGLAVTEIANAATMFYQQGKSTTQVLELTEAAAKAAAIAGIDLTTSVDLLTNAMNGFQMSANDAMEVSDKFAALAAAAATDYEELAVALSKVAAQANLAGMSMDFTLGMLTAGIEVTREAPETIGTALKTIIARMRELTDYGKTLEDGMDLNRVAAALDEIGVAMTDETGMMRDLEDVITEVGQKWDTLNKNQQANVAVAMAGTRQQSRFIAMMQDFERTQELVNLSANSYGATLAQHAKYMGGVEAATNNLTTAWQSFISALTGSDTIVNIMNVVTRLVDMADYLLNDLNLFPVLLGTIGVALLSQLSTRMTMFNIRKQEAQVQNQQLLLENQKKAVEAAAALEELKAVDTQIIKDKIRQKQEDLNSKTEIKNTKKEKLEQVKKNAEIEKEAILKDDSLTTQEKQQKIQKLELESQTEISKAQAEYEAASQEQAQAAQELRQAENELLDHQLNIKTQEYNLNVANNNILQTQLNSMGILGTLINAVLVPLKMIQSVMTVVNTLQTIFIKLKKKEGQETDKNTRKTIKQGLAEKVKAAFSMAGSAAAIPIAGWVIAGVILATIIGLTIAATVATSNQASAAEKTTENLKEMQVTLYELQTSANNVAKLSDEFEELSNKVSKTTEDMKRLKEITQQVNDEAGFSVVDMNADLETQQRQIAGYQTTLEFQAKAQTNEMADELAAGYQEYIGKNGDESQANVDAFIAEMRKTDNEAFSATMRTLGQQNITGLDAATNAEVNNAILNMAANKAEDIMQEDGTLDWTNFNKKFNEEFIQGLNDAYTGDSLTNMSNFYLKLDDYQKEALKGALPIFNTFDSLDSEAIKSIDSMGMSVEELNSVYSNLLGDEEDASDRFTKMLDEVQNMDYSGLSEEEAAAEKRRNLFILAVEQNRELTAEYAKIAKMSADELERQADAGNKLAREYLNAQTQAKELEKQIEAETEELNNMEQGKNESDGDFAKRKEKQTKVVNDLSQQYNDTQESVEQFTEAEEQQKAATDALIDSLLDMTSATNIVDGITSLTSTMERLSKINDLTSLSFEEQAELLKDYPELIGAMDKGYMSSADAMRVYQKRLNDLKFDSKRTMEDIAVGATEALELNDKTLNGISLSNLFQDTDTGAMLRQQIVEMDQEQLFNWVKSTTGLTGEDAEKYMNDLLGFVENYNMANYNLDYLEENGLAGLMSADAITTFEEAKSEYNQAIRMAEEYDDLLGKLNEGSDEYYETLEKRNAAFIDVNKKTVEEMNKLREQMYQKMDITLAYDENSEQYKTGNRTVDLSEIFNVETGEINSELFDQLDKASQEALKIQIETLKELSDQYQDYMDIIDENSEKVLQSYIDAETTKTEALIEQLEERKEAYEDYFDELDRIQEEEDYEQSRGSIIQQLQALSGGSDAASKQKIKELQEELNSLNEEQLQSQTEAQREALLQDMENEIETQNEYLDSIDKYLGELLYIINKPERTEEEKQQVYNTLMKLGMTREEISGLLGSYGFSEGGYVDYTGIARVHGTPSAPEAFLSAQDTVNIRALLDALAIGQTVDTSGFGNIEGASNIIQIDEINIQTNELNTEQDFGNAGRALADEFAQAIQKRGINLNVKR